MAENGGHDCGRVAYDLSAARLLLSSKIRDHQKIHTDEYLLAIDRRLRGARTAPDARAILVRVRQQIEAGQTLR